MFFNPTLVLLPVCFMREQFSALYIILCEQRACAEAETTELDDLIFAVTILYMVGILTMNIEFMMVIKSCLSKNLF